MKRFVKTLVWLLVLGGLGYGGWWWYAQRKAAEAQEAKGAIKVQAAEKGTLIVKAAASGTITPHRQVEVKSRASGEVVEIAVKAGQAVTAGQLLARLDPYNAERELDLRRTNLVQLEAQRAESEANLGIAKIQSSEARTDAKVQTEGVDLGLVAPTAKRSAKSQAGVAAKTVIQRRAQLARIDAQIASAKVDVTIAERTLAETRIHAPFAGTVLVVHVEIGDIVSSAVTNIGGGTALLTLADLADLRVIGQVDEAQIARVSAGQLAEIRVDAWPDRAFTGKVEAVSLIGVNVTNVVSFDVELVVTDKDRDKLRPGMTTDVEIDAETLKDVVQVPLAAIITKGAKRFVRLADGEEREITVGPHDGASIAVLKGLEVGESYQPIAAAPKQADQSKGLLQMGGRGGRR